MDRTVTSFPQMGMTTYHGFVNASGASSPNTKPVKKTGNAKGGMIQAALTEGVRRNIPERMGHKGGIQARFPVGEDPAVAANLRNTRRVRSAIGNRDFYDRRNFGQGM